MLFIHYNLSTRIAIETKFMQVDSHECDCYILQEEYEHKVVILANI